MKPTMKPMKLRDVNPHIYFAFADDPMTVCMKVGVLKETDTHVYKVDVTNELGTRPGDTEVVHPTHPEDGTERGAQTLPYPFELQFNVLTKQDLADEFAYLEKHRRALEAMMEKFEVSLEGVTGSV